MVPRCKSEIQIARKRSGDSTSSSAASAEDFVLAPRIPGKNGGCSAALRLRLTPLDNRPSAITNTRLVTLAANPWESGLAASSLRYLTMAQLTRRKLRRRVG